MLLFDFKQGTWTPDGMVIKHRSTTNVKLSYVPLYPCVEHSPLLMCIRADLWSSPQVNHSVSQNATTEHASITDLFTDQTTIFDNRHQHAQGQTASLTHPVTCS